MSNQERIAKLPAKDFYKAMQDIVKHPFNKFLDIEAYLKSDNKNILDFLISKGEYSIMPTDAFIKAAKNEGTAITDEWIKNHTKICPILEFTQIYGQKYVTVADIKNLKILKVLA